MASGRPHAGNGMEHVLDRELGEADVTDRRVDPAGPVVLAYTQGGLAETERVEAEEVGADIGDSGPARFGELALDEIGPGGGELGLSLLPGRPVEGAAPAIGQGKTGFPAAVGALADRKRAGAVAPALSVVG